MSPPKGTLAFGCPALGESVPAPCKRASVVPLKTKHASVCCLVLLCCVGCGEELPPPQPSAPCFDGTAQQISPAACQQICPQHPLSSSMGSDELALGRFGVAVLPPDALGELCPSSTEDPEAAFPFRGLLSASFSISCAGEVVALGDLPIEEGFHEFFVGGLSEMIELPSEPVCEVTWTVRGAEQGLLEVTQPLLRQDNTNAYEHTLSVAPCNLFNGSFDSFETQLIEDVGLDTPYEARRVVGSLWGCPGQVLEGSCGEQAVRLCLPSGRSRTRFFQDTSTLLPDCVWRFEQVCDF